MFCIKCGKQIEDDSVFCEYCGAEVEPLEEKIEITKEEQNNVIEKEKSMIIEEKEKQPIIEEEKTIIEEDKQIVEKNEKKSFTELDAAVADLKPDDLDELIPRKSPIKIIIIIIVFIAIGIGVFVYLDGDIGKVKIIKEKKEDYQTIINEYARAIETVSSDYLLEHELINDFSEISDKVKYDKHKVSCNNIFINIDGTVYLSECSIDGKKVDEVYGKKKKILTKDNSEACYVNHNEEKNELEFYVDSEMISVYECEHHKCDVYKEEFEYNSCYDMITVIEDGSDIYLYNYREAQKLFEKLEEIHAVKKDGKITGFVIKDSESQKYGYVTNRGSIVIDISYDTLGHVVDGKMDIRGIDITGDKIVAKKDKFGVISLSKGKQVLPFEYDLVYLGDSDNYVVRKDKEYLLINSKGEKVLNNSYDMIFSFKDVLVVSKDKKLSIINYKGEKVIDDEIELYVDYKEEGANGIYGYNSKFSDGKILIEVNKSNDTGYSTIKYTYDIEKKKLVKEK